MGDSRQERVGGRSAMSPKADVKLMLPFRVHTKMASDRRVGKATACPPSRGAIGDKMVGTALTRLCPP